PINRVTADDSSETGLRESAFVPCWTKWASTSTPPVLTGAPLPLAADSGQRFGRLRQQLHHFQPILARRLQQLLGDLRCRDALALAPRDQVANLLQAVAQGFADAQR